MKIITDKVEVQKKFISMNINERVRFKVTKKGADVYNKYFSDLNKIAEGDTLELPLYEVMNMFGQYTYMGTVDSVIFRNELILISEDLESLK